MPADRHSAPSTPFAPSASSGEPLLPLRLFDDRRGRFGPLTDLRPVFELLVGGHRLRRRIEARLGRVAGAPSLGPELRGLWPQTEAEALARPAPPGDTPELLVNGRWDGIDSEVAARLGSLKDGEALLTEAGEVLGAVAGAAEAAAWEAGGHRGLPAGCHAVAGLAPESTPAPGPAPAAHPLLARPWDLLDRLGPGIEGDAGRLRGPRIHASARVHPTACLDEAAGPVVVEAGAQVQAFALVEGPAWIGPDAVVSARAHLRGPVSLGPSCKVGGEVKGAIFGACSNKAHDGYLGDAVVGSWCNLGAGTTASNLKNTYGPVRVRLRAGAEREDTGRTFQGPILGDFVKTAIGTRLPTGCVVGTGACLAGSAMAPAFVPPMTFTTDAGSRAMEAEPFLVAVGRQMARRGQTPSEALGARLRAMIAEAE